MLVSNLNQVDLISLSLITMSNKLPKPPKQEQRKCVFCKGLPLTREHIFPDWLKSVLNIDFSLNKVADRTSIDFLPDKVIFRPDTNKKNGPLFSHKLLIVCAKCNNGWMSVLQQETKPILTSLIKDNNITLTTDDIAKLNLWIVMTTMVAEFDDEAKKRIPLAQLREFQDNKQVPKNWKIWIGRNPPNNDRHTHIHHDFIEFESLQYVKKYAQTTMIIMGNLIMFVMSTNSNKFFESYSNNSLQYLKQIHPSSSPIFENSSLNWHNLPSIAEEEILNLRNMLNILDM
ncbi:hypothetical protein [Mucilaginibacter sp. 3215]|uniref:hypothetical protein n=1 Tax=Mucilaginibacter sp. 3215 TaxID=3373912 RepID=UPI003D1C876B